MLPWRKQLRLGRDILRWLIWPRRHPAWENAVMLIAVAAAAIGLEAGTLWPLAALIVIAAACGIYSKRQS